MNDHRQLHKTRVRHRFHQKGHIMNNGNESTYTLLVRSEEKGRSILEAVAYALFGLSAVFSIWQFVQQQDRLPTALTTQPAAVTYVSQHPAKTDCAGGC